MVRRLVKPHRKPPSLSQARVRSAGTGEAITRMVGTLQSLAVASTLLPLVMGLCSTSPPCRACIVRSATSCSAVVLMTNDDSAQAADPDDLPTVDFLSKELTQQVELQDFNRGLYEHLNKRPEYETSELYSGAAEKAGRG